MSLHLCLDRFEGENKEIAVLLTDAGASINFPRDLLPVGARAGEILALSITVDTKATSRLKAETAKLQDQLGKSDTGGDVTL